MENSTKKERFANGYSFLPSNEIILDKNINATDIKIILIISSLCANCNDCYFSNEYVSDLIDVNNFNVSRSISKLEKLGYIQIFYKKTGSVIKERHICLVKDNRLIKENKELKNKVNKQMNFIEKTKKIINNNSDALIDNINIDNSKCEEIEELLKDFE